MLPRAVVMTPVRGAVGDRSLDVSRNSNIR
jgi:hypothetical protein